MLKEPELEEEALTATATGQVLTITRRTIAEDPPGPITIIGPDGAEVTLDMAEAGPGKFAVDWAAPEMGLYRLEQGELTRVIAVGPSAPREFIETIASGDTLAPIVEPTLGTVTRLEDGMPDLRDVRAGRQAYGRGWIGITPRDAYVTQDVQIAALLPGWVYLVLASLLAVAAWLVEGRKGRRLR
jgi:hypothetical protein